MKSLTIRFAAVLALLIGMVSLVAAGTPERHMALVKTEPGADSTVTAAPTALKLYWTQSPKLPVTTIRLTTGTDQTVTLGAPKIDEKDAKILSVPVSGTVAPGVYTVTWRTAGDDGHILNGTYRFTVRADR